MTTHQKIVVTIIIVSALIGYYGNKVEKYLTIHDQITDAVTQ